MPAYYNEIDPYPAQWLRNLIDGGHITPGDVDERSIEDVEPNDLKGYTQCHFFAGIGVWSLALRQSGWADDRPVWTGSCPCQPFSTAGKGDGLADERHLWPAFHHLISECRPPVVFGEQVASKDGLNWLDLVQADLEGSGYATGAADLCAAGVGAPHIRQRLYWVADSKGAERQRGGGAWCGRSGFADSGADDGTLAHSNDTRLEGRRPVRPSGDKLPTGASGLVDRVADAASERRNGGQVRILGRGSKEDCFEVTRRCGDSGSSPTNGFWGFADWLGCRDGKWRPVEPGTFPLAHGATSRVGRLRAYGNAIVPQVAQAFIESYMEYSDGALRLRD